MISSLALFTTFITCHPFIIKAPLTLLDVWSTPDLNDPFCIDLEGDEFIKFTFFVAGLLTMGHHWQYSFQTPHNDAMFWIIDLHADIMIFLVFIVGVVLTLIVGIVSPRFRTATPYHILTVPNNDYTPLEFVDFKLHNHNSFYEMVWTVVPILLEFFIILPSFIVHYAVSQTHPQYLVDKGINAANTIRVIGNQWYWVYQSATSHNLVEKGFQSTLALDTVESYLIDPCESASHNGLRLLEVDQPLILFTQAYYKLLITSDDVIHSWALPALGVKVDACPGRLNETILQIKDCGIYYGQCSEICGYYHGNMPIMVVSKAQLVDLYRYSTRV